MWNNHEMHNLPNKGYLPAAAWEKPASHPHVLTHVFRHVVCAADGGSFTWTVICNEAQSLDSILLHSFVSPVLCIYLYNTSRVRAVQRVQYTLNIAALCCYHLWKLTRDGFSKEKEYNHFKLLLKSDDLWWKVAFQKSGREVEVLLYCVRMIVRITKATV